MFANPEVIQMKENTRPRILHSIKKRQNLRPSDRPYAILCIAHIHTVKIKINYTREFPYAGKTKTFLFFLVDRDGGFSNIYYEEIKTNCNLLGFFFLLEKLMVKTFSRKYFFAIGNLREL